LQHPRPNPLCFFFSLCGFNVGRAAHAGAPKPSTPPPKPFSEILFLAPHLSGHPPLPGSQTEKPPRHRNVLPSFPRSSTTFQCPVPSRVPSLLVPSMGMFRKFAVFFPSPDHPARPKAPNHNRARGLLWKTSLPVRVLRFPLTGACKNGHSWPNRTRRRPLQNCPCISLGPAPSQRSWFYSRAPAVPPIFYPGYRPRTPYQTIRVPPFIGILMRNQPRFFSKALPALSITLSPSFLSRQPGFPLEPCFLHHLTHFPLPLSFFACSGGRVGRSLTSESLQPF